MGKHLAIVDREHAGMRLDLFLAHHLSGFPRGHASSPEALIIEGLPAGMIPAPETGGWSRSSVQRMIHEGQVTLNGRRTKPSTRLKPSDSIEIQSLPPRETALEAEPLPLDVLYQDEDCIVVNKPPGMVVHPALGNPRGTLVNALLYHCPNLEGIGGERRPGIVHRLDKDTSGVMVIAKHEQAFHNIAKQFKERRVVKEYLALVWGRVDREKGIIDRPIGRHRRDRKRMSSIYSLPRLRTAVTEWQREETFKVGPLGKGFDLSSTLRLRPEGSSAEGYSWVTLMRLRPRTGRTHQLRVHLADQGYPVVGDRVYGRKRAVSSGDQGLPSELTGFPRQALHAEKLRFDHPRTGQTLEFCAPLSPDMKGLLDHLRDMGIRDAVAGGG